MKYLVLVGDGMADRPAPELDGKTPLMVAATPNMDRLASQGVIGLAKTIPEGMDPGSDTANMSLMGYDPRTYHTGRSPIEAAAMGVALAEDEIAFRCNLVTLAENEAGVYMKSYASGAIDTASAHELIRAVDAELGSEELRFYPGVSYRHLLVWKNGPVTAHTTPPHDLSGQNVDNILNGQGELAKVLKLMAASRPLLSAHPVNQRREREGQEPGNSIWLWGQGTKPTLPTIRERFGKSGFTISAVDLVKGLGVLAGLTAVDVPGATGELHTNYEGKVEATLRGLKESDMVYLHVEAPDECSHVGSLKDKIQAIEWFDSKVVGPILEGMVAYGPHRILLAPDHATPLALMTHTSEPVPFVLWESWNLGNKQATFDEDCAAASGVYYDQAHVLMEKLLAED